MTGSVAICTHCGTPNRVAAGKALSAGKCGKCGEPLATHEPIDISGDMLQRLIERDTGAFVLDVGAPWCGPCRTEMPLLDALYEEYRDYGFTVLGVNLDENRDQADRLLDKIPVTFPVLFDPQNSTSETYGVDAMPTTVLIDRNGVVRHHHRGYKDGYMDKYEEQVKALVLE